MWRKNPNINILASFTQLKHPLLPLVSMILGITLVGLIALATPPLADQEANLGLHLLFHLRGPVQPPSQVIIVSIDQASSQRFNLPNLPRKWPRDLHAQLVDRLSEAAATTIGFDIIFAEARDANDDLAFETAIRKAGNVLLFSRLEVKVQPDFRQEQRIPPLAQFEQAALDVAPFALPKVPEEIKQAWLFKSATGDHPTLPVVAFQLMMHPFKAAFRQQLEAAVNTTGVLLDTPVAQLMNAQPVSDVITGLKQLLDHYPELAPVLRAQIAQLPYTPSRHALSAWLALLTAQPSIYLNFYGPARAITTVPYHRVLSMDTEALKKAFAGKAVLVGFSERFQPEQKDGFYTVFTNQAGLDISGVEIMATTLANLLENSAITPASTRSQLGVILLFAGLGAMLFIFSRGWILLLLTGSLVMLWLLLTLWLFSSRGYWLPITTPLLFQLPVALIATLLGHYFLEHTRHRRIHRALGQYVPEHVVQTAHDTDAHHLSRKGNTQFASCLATDAEAYTGLSEKISPEQLHSHLNQYFQLLLPPVHASNGLVMDMVGDAMLALWQDGENNALKQAACTTALKIRDNLRSHPTGALSTRLGLHCGDVSIGNIGSNKHVEYRVVGDVINTTSRIENLNKILGSQILASANMLDFDHQLLARPLGKFRLKGKTQPLEIYEILGLQGQASDQQIELIAANKLAFSAFNASEFHDAAALFQRNAEQFNDPPSRFYYHYCIHLPLQSIHDAGRTVITLT